MGEGADRTRTNRKSEVDLKKWLESFSLNRRSPRGVPGLQTDDNYGGDLPSDAELNAVRMDEEALRTLLDLEGGLSDAFDKANMLPEA